MDTRAHTPRTQLLKFPQQKEIALSPQLWLALGVASYNHALLAKQPLRDLAPGEVATDLSKERWDAIFAGKAALLDAGGLTESALDATVRITATLLKPLLVSVRVLGNRMTKRYLLMEFHGEDQASKLTTPPPRILPAHDYPASAEGEEPETAATGTDPKRGGTP